MNKNSRATSDNTLNGDTHLSLLQKINYFFGCCRENMNPHTDVDSRIKLYAYTSISCAGSTKENLKNDTRSPARVLSDAFWNDFDFSALCADGPLRILEIGCGSGLYGRFLKERLKLNFHSYIGIDVVANKDWNKFEDDKSFSFKIGSAEELASTFDANLIITQSALEHFQEDVRFFEKLVDLMLGNREQIWQVHLVPSASCLYTYLWHGFRQYTPRKISEITRLFPSNYDFELYSLGGGWKETLLHLLFITLPGYLRLKIRRSCLYLKIRNWIIESNVSVRFNKNANFYAFVIKSHKNK